MRSDTPIDYAFFQLSPERSRCELFVSQSGNMEKLASGLVKPFTTHLKVAEEKVAAAAQSVELKVNKRANGGAAWFSKGTLERFVQYVNSPDILEQINTYDAEMSQLESALKIYTEGLGDQSTSASGGEGAKATADATKRELIRAIDVRLAAVKQDMYSSCVRASTSGFSPDTISDLQLFADQFGAPRLKVTCEKLTTLWQRWPDLVKKTWQKSMTTSAQANDRAVRSSTCSDMSLDDPDEGDDNNPSSGPRHELPINLQKAGLSITEKESSPSSVPSAIQASQPSRRLSVQDRIKLFENKQDSSGGKPAPAAAAPEKTHLRRLSSDVSSSQERGVLRRWSGASDMSIDMSGEKSLESPRCTPLSRSVSVDKFGSVSGIGSDSSKNQNILSDSVNLEKIKVIDRDAISGGDEEVVVKDQGSSFEDQMRSKKEQFELKQQGSFQERQRVSSVDESKDLPEVAKAAYVGVQSDDGRLKGKVPNKIESHVRPQAAKMGEFPSKIRDSFVSHIKSKSFVQQSESKIRHESPMTPVAPIRDVEDQYSPPQMASYSEAVENRVLVSTTKLSHDLVDSDTQGKMFPSEGSTREHTDKQYNKTPVFSSKRVSDTIESSTPSISVTSVDQVQRFSQSKGNQELNDELQLKANELEKLFVAHSVGQAQKVRQSKGNQGLNDELQLKANELEKLFAAHKLRVPGDQSASTRRHKQSESKIEQVTNLHKKSLEPATVTLQKTISLAESVGSTSTQSLLTSLIDLPEISTPNSSKGKSYTRYMQKREAKLREEWGVNGAEKEAKMKAMLDSLERSDAEMKAKFSGFADKNESVSSARRHTERFRSFNVRSTIRREQQVDYSEHEEVDEEYDSRDENTYGLQQNFYEDIVPEAVSRGNQNKVNRNISSSTPRTPGLPVSHSAIKTNNFASGKRKTQAENPLAQSVPNFADFRNENAKPLGGGKITPRSQPKSFARSRSTVDETTGIKEDKQRRSQSLRKSYANPVEFKDLSALNSDLEVLPPNKFSNKSQSKSFLRKGNGIGPGAGANVAKMKATMAPKTEEESGELVTEPEDYTDIIREEVEVEEFETKTEEYNDMDNEQIELNQVTGKFSDSGSGNDVSTSPHLLQDSVSTAELPATETSIFQARGSVQESPSESPLSWNGHMHHSFSYPQETSDIEASVDSPMGSPASWNSHSMTQSEAEAVRMRKKWGSAHKPFVASSSQSHSRNDMTKGFKRLLKFGRKSRGTETLVDWISATTSEGDDDTEDGRDPARRSSDDLRKSRMGFTQSHPSDDSFNESELYSEQVQGYQSIPATANFKFRDDHLSGSALKAPRSFFSLSSFRSKGSESKPR